MNVFLISQGQDIGGQNARIAAAFKRHEPSWTVHAMHVARTYIQYPYDLGWDLNHARRLYAAADVVHHQNHLFGYAMYDGRQHKPAVVHHHGPPLRGDADAVNREADSVGAVQIVSTVDLLADAPTAAWSPCFFDIAKLRKDHPRPTHRRVGTAVRIGHGPTVRAMKGTDAIMESLARVGRRHNIETELTEGVTWRESLERKAACDIWIDQVTLGYGLSGIEAMALGTPVISGWAEPEDRELFIRETGQAPPFVEAGESNLDARIEELITSRDRREEAARNGADFVEAFHDEERGVRQLRAIYERAPASHGVNALEVYGKVSKKEIVRRYAA